MPSIIYVDLKPLNTKIGGCKNNLAESSTAKVGEHIPWGYSVSMIFTFDVIETKHDVYRGEDCIKKVLWILKRACSEDN